MIRITTSGENVRLTDTKTGIEVDSRAITDETGLMFNDGTIVGIDHLGRDNIKIHIIAKGTCFITEEKDKIYIGQLVKYYVFGILSERRW